MIASETNAEIRRVMIRQYGPETKGPRDEDYDGTLLYLRATTSKTIDLDGGTKAVGSAPRALVEDSHGIRWLILTDGSTKRVYTMPVDRDVTTVKEALARCQGQLDESLCIAEC